MNNTRRKEIKTIIKKITETAKDFRAEIGIILSDEEYAFDSMPEGLQNSMRGMDSQDSINILEDALEKMEEVCDILEEIP